MHQTKVRRVRVIWTVDYLGPVAKPIDLGFRGGFMQVFPFVLDMYDDGNLIATAAVEFGPGFQHYVAVSVSVSLSVFVTVSVKTVSVPAVPYTPLPYAVAGAYSAAVARRAQ